MATKKHVFTPLEKKSFIDILQKYSHIIESKNTDGATIRAKTEAWHNVTKKYNASPHATNMMTNKQLRRLWMNMKQRQRDALKKGCQHSVVTGAESDTFSDSSEMTIELNKGIKIQPIGNMDNFSRTNCISPEIIISTSPQPASPLLDRTPPPSYSDPSLNSSKVQDYKNAILNRVPKQAEMVDDLHELEKEHMRQQIREANAQANLAELKLQEQVSTDKEFKERQRRADELHEMEKELMKHRIREAQAKADMAELQQKICSKNV